MAKGMKRVAGLCVVSTLVLGGAWWIWRSAALFSALITAATTSYHFLMRLAVGTAVNAVMGNRADHRAWWYRSRSFEGGLYRFLRVKKWKKYLPTYDPGAFSMTERGIADIVGASCQAEVVHEIIIPLSFLPLAAAEYMGQFGVFLATSCAAAMFDLLFVILQRYNRPRLVRLAERKEKQ